MEVDSGSVYSIMDWQQLKRLQPSITKHDLKPLHSKLVDFGGNPIGVLGRANIRVAYNEFKGKLPITVCLLWGDRVLIPSTLQRRTLETLRKGHPGIVRMKALARSYVWWPALDKDIEEWVSRCDPCQEVRPAPPQAETAKWETPSNPWSRIHIDFAGPMQGRHLLIVVDAFSKWLEVVPMASTTTEATIRALRRLFATHGLPDVLVSDNGPQLTSLAMEAFLAGLGIRHALSAPYRPAGNGQAERMVRLTKEALTKMGTGDWQERIDNFLLTQHITPHATTHKSPAELLMGRRLRSPLDRLHPQYSPQDIRRGLANPPAGKMNCCHWPASLPERYKRELQQRSRQSVLE
ncbi:uncharacterized protein K02A2.6 [Pantherophis guttatus]|uniref:Gypsy retrotransposon integrase-like protein 1 n=1 Tax=Pantherophis guttatus TaxID=94885 RepID=A0ABM3YVK0_PANGU|nr:uncharacterized protein K02A2.6 [Pantherophis guttatus]